MGKLEGHIVFPNVSFWKTSFYFSSAYVAKHFSLVYIIAEAYLEPNRTSTMELFYKNSENSFFTFKLNH